MLNPIEIVDDVLEDYVPPKARRAIHSALLVVLALFAVWQGAGGDWREFLLTLAGLAYAWANRANTAPPVSGNEDEAARWEDDGL